jgi:hypothetical protein
MSTTSPEGTLFEPHRAGVAGATLLLGGAIVWNGTNRRGSPSGADTDRAADIHTEAPASKAPLAATTTPKYVWSESSLVYHDFDCFLVDRILPTNRRDLPPQCCTRGYENLGWVIPQCRFRSGAGHRDIAVKPERRLTIDWMGTDRLRL